MDLLNVTGWIGLESLSFPFLAEISKNVFKDPLSMKIISTTGIALGIIAGISKLWQEQKKLSLESDYSYLLHLDGALKNSHGESGYNYFLWRQIEEFVND